MAESAQIGIMGGTFDPIHNGHLAIAGSVADQLALDRVLFIPAGNPNFKQGQNLAPAADRVKMVELAIADTAGFELDLREVTRPGITYSADTLAELAAENQGARLFFIMGTDSALLLPKWRRADEVARLCTIVTARRPGQDTQAVREALDQSPIDFDAVFLDVPQVDVSSTDVRNRIQDGKDVSDMVPPPVERYLSQAALYRDI